MKLWRVWLCAAVVVCPAAAAGAQAESAVRIAVERPGEGEFVRDLAGLINTEDERAIRERWAELLADKGTPLMVLTIESMSHYGPEQLRLETYARLVFDQWIAAQHEGGGEDWSRGILMLVSRDDQRAWIELGMGFERELHDSARRILDEQVVPRFQDGEFSAGIVAGVAALEAMVRGERLPQPRKSLRYYVTVAALLALVAFTIVSLVRQGSTGWAWLFWGAVLAALGFVLWQLVTAPRSRGFGRAFGRRGNGGSGGKGEPAAGGRRPFGGGFSGGGTSRSW